MQAKSKMFFATLAQSVEQRIRNARVVGSSPMGGSYGGLLINRLTAFFYYKGRLQFD